MRGRRIRERGGRGGVSGSEAGKDLRGGGLVGAVDTRDAASEEAVPTPNNLYMLLAECGTLSHILPFGIRYTNSILLFDRAGNISGIYNKTHAADGDGHGT